DGGHALPGRHLAQLVGLDRAFQQRIGRADPEVDETLVQRALPTPPAIVGAPDAGLKPAPGPRRDRLWTTAGRLTPPDGRRTTPSSRTRPPRRRTGLRGSDAG